MIHHPVDTSSSGGEIDAPLPTSFTRMSFGVNHAFSLDHSGVTDAGATSEWVTEAKEVLPQLSVVGRQRQPRLTSTPASTIPTQPHEPLSQAAVDTQPQSNPNPLSPRPTRVLKRARKTFNGHSSQATTEGPGPTVSAFAEVSDSGSLFTVVKLIPKVASAAAGFQSRQQTFANSTTEVRGVSGRSKARTSRGRQVSSTQQSSRLGFPGKSQTATSQQPLTSRLSTLRKFPATPKTAVNSPASISDNQGTVNDNFSR